MAKTGSLAFYDTADSKRGTGGSTTFLADLYNPYALCIDAVFAVDSQSHSGFGFKWCDWGCIYCRCA